MLQSLFTFKGGECPPLLFCSLQTGEGMEELVRKVERSDGFLKTGKNIAELAYKVNETIPDKTSLDDMVNAMFTCIAIQFCEFGGEKVELKEVRDYMRKMQAKMLNTIEVHRRMKGGEK